MNSNQVEKSSTNIEHFENIDNSVTIENGKLINLFLIFI